MKSEAQLHINMGFGYAAPSHSLFGTPANEILNIGRTNACFGLLHLEIPDGLQTANAKLLLLFFVAEWHLFTILGDYLGVRDIF